MENLVDYHTKRLYELTARGGLLSIAGNCDMKKNIIREKTYAFAVLIVKLCRKLQEEKKEYVISRQLKKSGTAPGALVREADQAESKRDFIHKMSIALKEADESDYWLNILHDTNYINKEEFDKHIGLCLEIIKILTTIVKSAKTSLRV